MVTEPVAEERKNILGKRLESIALFMFLIMMGGLALVPQTVAPQGLWAFGGGLALLGVSIARLHYGIKLRAGTVVMGMILLGAGLGALFGKNLPLLEILILVAIASFVHRSVSGARKGSGW